MMMGVLGTLNKHKQEIKEKFSVRRIGIFGSHVKGEQSKKSDIDILVEFDAPTFDNFMNLVFYLEGLFGKKVDLVTPKGLSPHITASVKKEVVWCE